MDLKQIARRHVGFDGQVVFWMLPFQNLACDAVIDGLEQIVPQWEWVNRQTGERITTMPKGWEEALEEAKAFDTLDELEWTRVRLWTDTHTCFVLPVPLTVDLEFADNQALPTEVQALRLFWDSRAAPLTERWEAFRQLMSGKALSEWFAAYHATRDQSMDVPPPKGKADPQSSGSDPIGSTLTNEAPNSGSLPSEKPKRQRAKRS